MLANLAEHVTEDPRAGLNLDPVEESRKALDDERNTPSAELVYQCVGVLHRPE